MSFGSALEQDLSVFFSTDAFVQETITYAGSPVDALVNYGDSDKDRDYNKDYKATKAVILVKQSDVTLPSYRDVIVIGGATWYSQRNVEGDGYVWSIGIERDPRVELL